MIEEKELTNVTWYQEDEQKVDIYHNMFVYDILKLMVFVIK